jgi:hypothetical protein
MFQRFTEYREMQQLRKDHLAQQRRRQLFTFLGVLGSLLIVLVVIEMAMPAKPTAASPAKTTEVTESIKAAPTVEVQAVKEIEAFADAVTKPLDTLSEDDLALVHNKAKDPCFETNAMLPKDQMIQAISSCKKILK